MASEAAKDKLNPKQELFCQLYSSDKEFFANGVQSYIQAYEVKLSKPGAYKSAQASASRLLSNAMICARINELLEMRGLNDTFVDKQLEFLITQHSSFDAKVRSIQEYNKLRGRITDRQKHSFEGVSDEALAERAAEIIAGLVSDQQGTRNEKSGK